MANYTSEVAGAHRRFQVALKRANSRQAVLNAYWKHKKEHERMLAKHLKEEMTLVNKIKGKMEYR